jgi:hypothetical protein
MGLNKKQPHLVILPEDDANRQLSDGFLQNLNVNADAIRILEPAGGWIKVIEQFTNKQIQFMRKFPERRIVLLIDFDNVNLVNRISFVKNRIPQDLQSRVFILGVNPDPETLRRSTEKTFEAIGETLAEECYNDSRALWNHVLLEHNDSELQRIGASVKSFLFFDF